MLTIHSSFSPTPILVPSSSSSSSIHHHGQTLIPTASLFTTGPRRARPSRTTTTVCEVALKADPTLQDQTLDQEIEAKIGSKVRVKVPLKVYHVPKTPELDLCGMEGELKQFVGIWKGKQISANLPFKVQFNVEIEGKKVKFFAHLKEDEFEFVLD